MHVIAQNCVEMRLIVQNCAEIRVIARNCLKLGGIVWNCLYFQDYLKKWSKAEFKEFKPQKTILIEHRLKSRNP